MRIYTRAMDNLKSPYLNRELSARVMLHPYQINNDIYNNLKKELVKKVEKRCNKYGYITQVFKIVNYEQGVMEGENFLASAMFNVKYDARICIPVEGMQIICKIEKMSKVLIMGRNGPIIVIIKLSEMNDDKFVRNSEREIVYKPTGKIVKIGDFIKITVRARRFDKGGDRINIMGYMEDVPTTKEVEKYFFEKEVVGKKVVEVAPVVDHDSDNSEAISEDEDRANYLDI